MFLHIGQNHDGYRIIAIVPDMAPERPAGYVAAGEGDLAGLPTYVTWLVDAHETVTAFRSHEYHAGKEKALCRMTERAGITRGEMDADGG